ncbi:PadR family transcriptional regulator [Paraburkholderia phenazinium]|uniref:DNA-binding transcriptional regulator, PadR family n=1 Tax=Paraburkholderia phenazinium TaxID=60549 RepID=A0A1G7PIX7_9BURK|nr:PadR family transcriptional regulator [Paraburkholderia phenazinium]SDF86256.1 DNA-binding transcriptional regulator, PadR family [Paraburkholderia phenazinium]
MVRHSPLALAVLAMLTEAPMHPYRMQQLIKARGKDEVINVGQRNSLYQTIDRLLRGDLIAIRETERDGTFPERTVYEITEAGRDTARLWLREQLAQPAREFPAFPAALSFLPLLSPDDVRRQLETRISALDRELARHDAATEEATAIQVPRLFLLEGELVRAQLVVERDWVSSVVADLKAGTLTWSPEWLDEIAKRFILPSDASAYKPAKPTAKKEPQA